ncbi:MAG: hypothetical protein O7G84_13310 [Gammaproteobacteria bacterium]|jgi:hypothetical protein|nr:hypothetical protein [Gammaproteobacteria bacterium]
MDGETSLLWMVLFGAIGMGYFAYGRKQKRTIPLLSGIGLMVYPYFISGTFAMIAVGAILLAIPYFIRI